MAGSRVMQNFVYAPADRPECEVYHDWTWVPGEVRMWQQHPDGWYANVRYSPAPSENRLATVAARHVRGAEPPC